MTFDDLKKSTHNQEIAIVLDSYFPKKIRTTTKNGFFFLFLVAFFFSVFQRGNIFNFYNEILADGIAIISFVFFLILLHLETFYYSSRFHRMSDQFNFGKNWGASYQVALIVQNTDELDITSGLLKSDVSQEIFFRLAICKENINYYLRNNRKKIAKSIIQLDSNYVSLSTYVCLIYDEDPSFRDFLSSHFVSRKDFYGAAKWVERRFEKKERQKRFWSKENLEAIPSIGTTLSYGLTTELGKFSTQLEFKINLDSLDIFSGYREEEMIKLENALAVKKGANVMIISDDEIMAKDIIARVFKRIKKGICPSILEHKQVVELNWNFLNTETKDKIKFENEILKILNESASAGNIIIYIANFPEFILETKNEGQSFTLLFEEFFKSSQVQIIAHSTKTDFHYFIENNAGLASVFERVVAEEQDEEKSMLAVIEKTEILEKEWKIFFTYQSLIEITHAAANYITYGEMPSKALNLMTEICPWAIEQKIDFITKRDAAAFILFKTGVATGEISQEESGKLKQLEKILHQRIVGQDMAINAVSGAMRRIRSGISKSKKPLASFLFLGPTGVGKTETSKALAEVFFCSSVGEEKMLRMDMSEFNGPDALPRLIGGWNENKLGIMVSKVKDNPYGVFLLDEFEKASLDVLDLFLQILDEGVFSDGFGKTVNCRNFIIIATSNAGASTIWEIIRENGDLESAKDKIIDEIIREKIFRPELLNRFDEIIMFKPLEMEELRQIAQKIFDEFKKKMEEEKQIKISVEPTLLDYLVSRGADREFGARSISRIMQDKIDNFIARKIINNDLPPGSSIEIKIEHLGY